MQVDQTCGYECHMTPDPFATNNQAMSSLLLERGAVGARLISAKQIGMAAFELQLQSTDDRRIVVSFVANARMILTGQIEIQATNAGTNAE